MKRHAISARAAAVALLLALSGCATVHLDTGGIREPVAMTADVNREYTIVRHFERPLKSWFTLFDLITVKNPEVQEIIREELERTDGDGVVNLMTQGQDTFTDRLIPVALSVAGSTVMTAGLYSYYGGTMVVVGTLLSLAASQIRIRTYTISGDVIRYAR